MGIPAVLISGERAGGRVRGRAAGASAESYRNSNRKKSLSMAKFTSNDGFVASSEEFAFYSEWRQFYRVSNQKSWKPDRLKDRNFISSKRKYVKF